MADEDRTTFVAFREVDNPDTWADREGQFVQGGMFFRRVRLVAPPHPTKWALRATLVAMGDDQGPDEGLSDEERNRVIHAMIDQYDGVQDVALGSRVGVS